MGDILLHYNNQFDAIRVMDKKMLMASWHISFDIILLDTEETFDLSYVVSKINYFFDMILDDSIVFSADNEWASKTLSECSNNFILTPGEPSDDLLTIVLYNKIQQLMGDNIELGYLEIGSSHSGGLTFIYSGDLDNTLPDVDEWIGTKYYFEEPWWNRDDASTFDVKPTETDDLEKPPEFAYKLDFLAEPVKKSKAKVVKPEFKPKVISGANDKNPKK